MRPSRLRTGYEISDRDNADLRWDRAYWVDRRSHRTSRKPGENLTSTRAFRMTSMGFCSSMSRKLENGEQSMGGESA